MLDNLPPMIDTHCHLNFDRYDEDREKVIAQAQKFNVQRIIIPAVDIETAKQAIDLSEAHDGIYAAVGVHPNSTANFNDAILQQIEALSAHDKVIAVGEIGLDYYWDKSPKDKQAESFKQQLALAKQLELPVIIHNREASEDVLDILEEWVQDLPDSLRERPGVMHSFSAPQAIAERTIAINFYLGFTGPITFKKANDLREVAASIPLDKILVETDAPFLTPEPRRGKRNHPAYIPYIVERLAALRGISTAEMAQASTENAVRLFGLNP